MILGIKIHWIRCFWKVLEMLRCLEHDFMLRRTLRDELILPKIAIFQRFDAFQQEVVKSIVFMEFSKFLQSLRYGSRYQHTLG